MTEPTSSTDELAPTPQDLRLFLVSPTPDAARAASTSRNPSSEPWPTVVDVTAPDESAETAAIRRSLDETRTRLVGFSDRMLSVAAMTPRLKNGTKLAERCGLADA